MKKLNRKKWPLFALLCFSLTNCTRPPDVPACEHIPQRISKDPATGHVILTPSPTCEKQVQEPECGHCVYIVSGKEIFVGEKAPHLFDGKPWSVLQAESVYLPAKESYAPLEAYIINACEKMNCSSDVDRFKVKLDSLNGVADAVKTH